MLGKAIPWVGQAKGRVVAGFGSFTLDFSRRPRTPASDRLWMQDLRGGEGRARSLGPIVGRGDEGRPGDFVVRHLIDVHDVDHGTYLLPQSLFGEVMRIGRACGA